MARLSRCKAALRVMGEFLDPQELTRLLACEPTRAERKDDVHTFGKTASKRVSKSGIWVLEASEQEPADLDAQVHEILDKLPGDLAVWQSLSKDYHIDLFCGFFMEKSNEGLDISSSSLDLLGARGISLALDIYDGKD